MNWDGAACAGHGELFFGPDEEPDSTRNWRERRAKAICARCPIKPACRDYAVAEVIRDGIWGGTDWEARVHLRRRRRDQRYRNRLRERQVAA